MESQESVRTEAAAVRRQLIDAVNGTSPSSRRPTEAVTAGSVGSTEW